MYGYGLTKRGKIWYRAICLKSCTCAAKERTLTQEKAIDHDREQERGLQSAVAEYTAVAFNGCEVHPNGSALPADALVRLQQQSFEIRM